MNEVKLFCPNCQTAVEGNLVITKYSVTRRIWAIVLVLLNLWILFCEVGLIFLIFPFFFIGGTFNRIKQNLQILFKGEKNGITTCEVCSIVLQD